MAAYATRPTTGAAAARSYGNTFSKGCARANIGCTTT
jgi:hypothetical protein